MGGRHDGDTVHPAADDSLPVGARVWLLASGRFGRVVARAHGGLLYRVRLEGQPGDVLACLGGDLMRLHDDAAR